MNLLFHIVTILSMTAESYRAIYCSSPECFNDLLHLTVLIMNINKV